MKPAVSAFVRAPAVAALVLAAATLSGCLQNEAGLEAEVQRLVATELGAGKLVDCRSDLGLDGATMCRFDVRRTAVIDVPRTFALADDDDRQYYTRLFQEKWPADDLRGYSIYRGEYASDGDGRCSAGSCGGFIALRVDSAAVYVGLHKF